MIGLSSFSAGVLLLPNPGMKDYNVIDVVVGQVKDAYEAQHLYSVLQDWVEIEGIDDKTLISKTQKEYWLKRIVALTRMVIGGLEESLGKRVLEHIEENIGLKVKPEEVLDNLLVAPLADKYITKAAAASALSYGFTAVAAILDELNELQPPLHRLTDNWLALPVTLFQGFTESKESIWLKVVNECRINQLLKANNKNDFTAQWNLLTFKLSTPQSRACAPALGQEMAQRLFPQEKQGVVLTPRFIEEEEAPKYVPKERIRTAHKEFESVTKQIKAIVKELSRGHDRNAEKYLDEVVKQQISIPGGKEHVVRTLCNIAQQCADMFRLDFERVCLDKVYSINPYDAWSLVQLGDHFKRMGNYAQALVVLGKAEGLGDDVITKSSIADVYTQQGAFDKAIQAYKEIPDWSNLVEVRTGIADNLRKMGRFEDAISAYEVLIKTAQDGIPANKKAENRAQAGIAEIAKRQGKLDEALYRYKAILTNKNIEKRDKIIYKLALCNVLKLVGNYEQAYKEIDEIIQSNPFAMEAKYIRGSILGLIGKVADGLEDLPEGSGLCTWREWQRPYYRGLLLLKAGRYYEAKNNLVRDLNKSVVSGEEQAIIRMAAAFWFLNAGEISETDSILKDINDLADYHAQYLQLVLKLHTATQREDRMLMGKLAEQIKSSNFSDEITEEAIKAINVKDFPRALMFEADAFLRLAAA